MSKYQKQKIAFNLTSLLAGNLLTFLFFLQSNASVLQTLWIFLFQALVAAIFYYKRITKMRMTELNYYKNNQPKKYAAFEREVNHQIPNEQFMYLLVCVLPLILVGIFVLFIDIPVGTINWLAIAVAVGVFFAHYLFEYWKDSKLLSEGIKIDNKYKAAQRSFLSLLPLWAVLLFGSAAYAYSGSIGVFAIFIGIKTIVDAALSIKGISI